MINKKNLTQKIKLVEYCSRLKDSFPYNESWNDNFIALGCKCIKNDNNYNGGFDDCDHQKMLLALNLLSYINKIVSNDEIVINEDRMNSAKEILNEKNYENICNEKLLELIKPKTEKLSKEKSNKLLIIILIFVGFGFFIDIFIIIYKCCEKKENSSSKE